MNRLRHISKYLPYSPQVQLSDSSIVALTPLTLERVLADDGAKLMLRPIEAIVQDNTGVGYSDLFEIGIGLGVIKSSDAVVSIDTENDIHSIRVDPNYYSKKHQGKLLRNLTYYSDEGVFRVIDTIGKRIDNGDYSTEKQLKHFRVRPTVKVIESMYASLLDVEGLIESGEAVLLERGLSEA